MVRDVSNSQRRQKLRNRAADAHLTRVLAYAGLVLVAFELVKGLIVDPIKAFYANATFSPELPFKSYEHDVLSRHRNEFEACLLYLRDFMEAIESASLADDPPPQGV